MKSPSKFFQELKSSALPRFPSNCNIGNGSIGTREDFIPKAEKTKLQAKAIMKERLEHQAADIEKAHPFLENSGNSPQESKAEILVNQCFCEKYQELQDQCLAVIAPRIDEAFERYFLSVQSDEERFNHVFDFVKKVIAEEEAFTPLTVEDVSIMSMSDSLVHKYITINSIPHDLADIVTQSIFRANNNPTFEIFSQMRTHRQVSSLQRKFARRDPSTYIASEPYEIWN